ncbi:unnamed protein product, partial [Vitis vinifera]
MLGCSASPFLTQSGLLLGIHSIESLLTTVFKFWGGGDSGLWALGSGHCSLTRIYFSNLEMYCKDMDSILLPTSTPLNAYQWPFCTGTSDHWLHI